MHKYCGNTVIIIMYNHVTITRPCTKLQLVLDNVDFCKLRGIRHEGCGRVPDTARGEAECCIQNETVPRVTRLRACM